uniref:Uncharacterized protein n=1 Tax=Physcomitrium patens TaxID=3218 RepID=A0A7I3YZV9_PHYPA
MDELAIDAGYLPTQLGSYTVLRCPLYIGFTPFFPFCVHVHFTRPRLWVMRLYTRLKVTIGGYIVDKFIPVVY